jgi:hypothetical protein
MTTTKLNATAPPFSSCPPPDLHKDKPTIPAIQEKTSRNDHDEAPDIVEPQNALPPSPVERKIPATSINSSSDHDNILDTDHDHELHYKTHSAIQFVVEANKNLISHLETVSRRNPKVNDTDHGPELHYKTQSSMQFVVKANKNLLSLLETESRRTPKPNNTRRMMNGRGQYLPAWHSPLHEEVCMDPRADNPHASYYRPNDEPAEFDRMYHPRIPYPPRALPGNDPDLVTPEEILAGHRLFMRLLGSIGKPVLLGQSYANAQVDPAPPASAGMPMTVPDVRSGHSSPPALTPTSEQPMKKVRSDFETLLRAGPNPASKLDQMQLPTKVQEAAEALGVTHGAFLIALEKMNGKLESGDLEQQTGGCAGDDDSDDNNNNKMENGDRAQVSDSDSAPMSPTPLAELLKGHADYNLRYPNVSPRAKQLVFLEESWKIAEALGVTRDALLYALDEVKEDKVKGRAPLTAAKKEKAAIAAGAAFGGDLRGRWFGVLGGYSPASLFPSWLDCWAGE